MKKRFIGMAIILSCLIFFGACGSGSSVDSTENTNSTVAVTAEDENEIPQNANSENGAANETEGSEAKTDLQDYWNGTWYGIISFDDADGKYADFLGDVLDVYMVVHVDGNNQGQFTIYASDTGEPFIAGNCEVQDGEYLGLYGSDVNLGNVKLDDHMWTFLPIDGFDNKFGVGPAFTDADGDLLSFSMFVKRFGESWQEEMDSDFHDYPSMDASGGVTPLYDESDVTDVSSSDTLLALSGYGSGASVENTTENSGK